MQRLIPTLALVLLSGSALAAPKPCGELKDEIDAKIQANGVPSYSLEVVSNDGVKDGYEVVGSCDGGTQKIIYKRG